MSSNGAHGWVRYRISNDGRILIEGKNGAWQGLGCSPEGMALLPYPTLAGHRKLCATFVMGESCDCGANKDAPLSGGLVDPSCALVGCPYGPASHPPHDDTDAPLADDR